MDICRGHAIRQYVSINPRPRELRLIVQLILLRNLVCGEYDDWVKEW